MKQTAVEWLVNQNISVDLGSGIKMKIPIPTDIIEQAKAMEKEQIMKTARQCHFEGVRQSAKTSEEYIAYGEQYYNETYSK